MQQINAACTLNWILYIFHCIHCIHCIQVNESRQRCSLSRHAPIAPTARLLATHLETALDSKTRRHTAAQKNLPNTKVEGYRGRAGLSGQTDQLSGHPAPPSPPGLMVLELGCGPRDQSPMYLGSVSPRMSCPGLSSHEPIPRLCVPLVYFRPGPLGRSIPCLFPSLLHVLALAFLVWLRPS